MHPSVSPALRDFLGQYEGVCDFMYLDSRGLVTTGIGNLLVSAAAAQQLAWTSNSGGGPAQAGAVAAEWEQIHRRQADRVRGAGYFRRLTTIHLSPTEVERLFTAKAMDFDAELRATFQGYEQFPADAQMGMLVHAWALGTGRLETDWPSYTAACRTRDWDTAGRECIWRQLRSNRPHAVGRREALQRMFHNAACVDAANRDGPRISITQLHYPAALTMPPTPVAATASHSRWGPPD